MAVVNGYLTTSEAQSYIGMSAGTDTAELDDVITSVSRMIDRFCGRHFFQATSTAKFFDCEPDQETLTFGPYGDLVTATEVAYDDNDDGTFESTLSAGAYQLTPQGATTRGPISEPFTGLRVLSGISLPLAPAASGRTGLVRVTGTWGWPAVPTEVKQAARILVAEVYKLSDAPLGVVAGFSEFGVVRVSRQMPARAIQLLQPYRHPANIGFA
jgi:hypothetical protein